jgi:hypothetical protein
MEEWTTGFLKIGEELAKLTLANWGILCEVNRVEETGS